MQFVVPVLVFFGLLLLSAVKVLREYERGVVFRLGRFAGVRGPGLILLIPGIERMVKVSQRVITMDVPPQDVITRDNVSVKVNAVIYFRVMDPQKAIIEIQDFVYATSQLAQTTLRSIVGQAELDEVLSEREDINDKLQSILDDSTDAWGIKVSNVELKHIDLPAEMQRAMARQAEAERERRAKVIAAEGELQASEKLTEASRIMGTSPATIQLRYLQTLTEIATERHSTVIFPFPIEMLRMFNRIASDDGTGWTAPEAPVATDAEATESS